MRRIALILLVAGIGCKKDYSVTPPMTSLLVVNSVVNGKTVKLNSNKRDSATNYSNKAFLITPGNSQVYIYPTSDSSHPYFNNPFQRYSGDIYTLFLSGNANSQIDTMLIKEEIPIFSDSSCGIRVINLCVNSSPIVLSQSTSPSIIDFPALGYKQISSFKKYPALSVNNTYIFQVKDASTNAVLATYTLSTPRFFSCTLVWKGISGGTGTNVPGVIVVKHY